MLSLIFVWSVGGAAKAQPEDSVDMVFYKAEVTMVDEPSEEGLQNVTVKIGNGDRFGEQLSFQHYATVYQTNDWLLRIGDDIYISVQNIDGQEQIAMTDYDRSFTYAYMAILFVVVLVLVGMLSGLRALLGFGILSAVIGFYLIPQILSGNDPLTVIYLTALIVVICLSIVLTGFNRKTLLIIGSSLFGLLVSSIIIFLFGYISNFNAIGLEESNMFAVSTNLSGLNLLNIVYGGMLLGALGAMMDVSMSIVAGVEELLQVNREKGARKISQKDLFQSGLKIGREIMAVNANTLLLAYIGSALTLWLIALSQNIGWSVLISFNMIFVEVLRIIGGTLGIFLSIPMTAWLASKFLVFRRKFEY